MEVELDYSHAAARMRPAEEHEKRIVIEASIVNVMLVALETLPMLEI